MSLHVLPIYGLTTSLHLKCRRYKSRRQGDGIECASSGHFCKAHSRISLRSHLSVAPLRRNNHLITHSSFQPAVDEPTVEPEVVEKPRSRGPASFRHNLPSGKRLEVIVRRGVGSEERPQLVFLHGSYHGAWCWEKWMPYLSERGHDCYAVSFLGQVQHSTVQQISAFQAGPSL